MRHSNSMSFADGETRGQCESRRQSRRRCEAPEAREARLAVGSAESDHVQTVMVNLTPVISLVDRPRRPPA